MTCHYGQSLEVEVVLLNEISGRLDGRVVVDQRRLLQRRGRELVRVLACLVDEEVAHVLSRDDAFWRVVNRLVWSAVRGQLPLERVLLRVPLVTVDREIERLDVGHELAVLAVVAVGKHVEERGQCGRGLEVISPNPVVVVVHGDILSGQGLEDIQRGARKGTAASRFVSEVDGDGVVVRVHLTTRRIENIDVAGRRYQQPLKAHADAEQREVLLILV